MSFNIVEFLVLLVVNCIAGFFLVEYLEIMKLTKRQVNYRPTASKDTRCATCSMFRLKRNAGQQKLHGTCTLVAGDIKPGDVCDRWAAR